MKVLVNGVEAELVSTGASIAKLHDRLLVRTEEGTFSAVSVRHQGKTYVSFKGQNYVVEPVPSRRSGASATGNGELKAPMPGLVVDVLLEEGVKVTKGDKILVLEAMKTQQPQTAPFDGILTKVAVSKGEQVSEGQLLATVVKEETE